MTTKVLNGVYAAYNLTAPITTLSLTTTAYITAGLVSSGVNAYTVINNGHIAGVYYGASLAGGGVVTNAGTITASSTTKGDGLVLGNGGSVSNAAGAVISGYNGLSIATQAGTVNNQGLILGTQSDGVTLAAGGLITNGSAGNTAANIRGATAIVSTLAATLHNYGTVIGNGTAGIGGYLKAGGVVTNGSATDKAAVLQGYSDGIGFAGAAGTLTNFGLIRATGTTSIAAILEVGGTVTNGSASDLTATIWGKQAGAVIGSGIGAVTNFATIRADGAGGLGAVVEGGGVITNGTTLDTTALIEGAAVGAAVANQVGTVNNFGTIIGGYGTLGSQDIGVELTNGGVVANGSAGDTVARIGAGIGVYIKAATGTVSNFGTIGGAGVELGVALSGGGLVTNGSATDTSALIQAYVGVAGETIVATVINFGTIVGGGATGTLTPSLQDAVLLLGGGSVTNGSATDTSASLSGNIGVVGETISSTVTNFGDIVGAQAGVYFTSGGKITNGSTTDVGAKISGTAFGAVVGGAQGTVSNFGTILGGVAGYGVALKAGGSVTNGSSTDHTALIHGYLGVAALSGGKVTNSGTITGTSLLHSYGVSLAGGASLINSAGAVISGQSGVSVAASCTASNFGTIVAGGGYSVILADSTARLNAEAGSLFVGAIAAGAGLVDVVSGAANVFAITTHGKVEGAGTLHLSGGASYFTPGASLLVNEIELTGSGTAVRIQGKLSDSRVWDQTAGTLSIDSADQFVLTGASNTFTGTVTGLGTFELVGGADAFTDLTLSAAKMIVSKSAVTLAGTINLTKALTVTTPNLIIAAAGASLTGGGSIQLSNLATNSIHGATAAATLTNGDLIRGAGKLGGGVMTLINTAAGKIESAGTLSLTVDTGAATIANAGLIEALSGGGLIVQSAVSNTGTLATINGTLTVNGAVSGAGGVSITGGVASFTAAFGETVTFNTTGRLVLAHSQAYGGTIAGFSHTGASSLDLTDIAFSGATKATYVGNTTAGILTVTDGTHTANIHFTGDYHLATWTLTAAVGGGTHVVDPTHPKPPALPLVSAMAGFAPAPAGAAPSALPAWMTGPPVLASAGHGQ